MEKRRVVDVDGEFAGGIVSNEGACYGNDDQMLSGGLLLVLAGRVPVAPVVLYGEIVAVEQSSQSLHVNRIPTQASLGQIRPAGKLETMPMVEQCTSLCACLMESLLAEILGVEE